MFWNYPANQKLDKLEATFYADLDKEKVEELNDICVKIGLNKNSGKSLLRLMNFMAELNGKKPISKINLEEVNNFMQNNFMHRGIFGLNPIHKKSKLKAIQEFSNEISSCLDDLGIYKKEECNSIYFSNLLEKNKEDKLTIRILGNNELIFDFQCKKVREFLEYIPEDLKSRINIELLGKTGFNSFFMEDTCSEILMMKKKAGKYFGDLGINIDVAQVSGNIVNTIQTIKKADSKFSYDDNDKIIYFMCPNALSRQKSDIELYNLQNEKNTENIYFDNCGGIEELGYFLDQVANGEDISNKKFKKLAKKFIDLEISNSLCEIAKNTYTKLKIINLKEEHGELHTENVKKDLGYFTNKVISNRTDKKMEL